MQGADKGRGIVLIVRNLRTYPSLSAFRMTLDRGNKLQSVSKIRNKVTDYYFFIRDFDYTFEVVCGWLVGVGFIIK